MKKEIDITHLILIVEHTVLFKTPFQKILKDLINKWRNINEILYHPMFLII